MSSNNHINTNPSVGLSQSEVESRIKKYGYNEVIEKKSSPLLLFLHYELGINIEGIDVISNLLKQISDLQQRTE